MNEVLKVNYDLVKEKVAAAARSCGRAPEEVLLLPVTKTLDASVLQDAYDLGMRHCGENKVQEILAKKPVLPQDLDFHLIGHLQTNKVRQVIDKVSLIHSVDSYDLAKVIEKEASKHDMNARILIQVNVAEEDTKFGLSCEDVEALVRQVALLPHVHICGLMTVAPFVEDPESNRPVFRKLKELAAAIAALQLENVEMNTLSMGMTNDYEVAITEGATIVRVGTGIFGARHYNI